MSRDQRICSWSLQSWKAFCCDGNILISESKEKHFCFARIMTVIYLKCIPLFTHSAWEDFVSCVVCGGVQHLIYVCVRRTFYWSGDESAEIPSALQCTIIAELFFVSPSTSMSSKACCLCAQNLRQKSASSKDSPKGQLGPNGSSSCVFDHHLHLVFIQWTIDWDGCFCGRPFLL